MTSLDVSPGEPDEPRPCDLAAIEDEWPVIAAELDELDCVIRIVTAAHSPTEVDVRRYRHAQRQVLRQMRAYLARTAPRIAEVA